MLKRFLLGLATAVAMSGSAHAMTTLDFEEFFSGTNLSGVDLGGVSFDVDGAIVQTLPDDPSGLSVITISALPFSQPNPFVATFSLIDVTEVSVDIGDFGADADDLFLRAFDASDTLLDSAFDSLAENEQGMKTLSVSALSAIAYVEFGSIGIDNNNNVYADNFTFNRTTAVIPEPATWIMMILGFGLVGVRLQRKRKVIAAA